MNKKIFISIILIILITVITFTIILKTENNEQMQNNIIETSKTVEEIKNETGATAPEEIYEVQQEYDGREILTIKPDIQFETVIAGILKNAQPTEQDIKQLDLSNFHKGIWISEVSRDKFLKILKKCEIDNFQIDEEGYLYKRHDNENKYSLKLENLINKDKLTVIDITGTCYIRDEMSGEIVEYPFKDMDLYQICETFETDGSKIIVITTNNVDEFDILDAICN